MDIPFARAIDRGAGAQDPRSQFAASAARRRFNFAYYQASLIVEYIHDTYGQREAARRLIAAYADGTDTEARDQEGARHRHRRAAKGLRRVARERVTPKLRRALKAPGGPEGRHDRRSAQGDGVRRIPTASSRRWRSAKRWRRRESGRGASRRSTRRRELDSERARRRRARIRRIAAVALKKGDKARADRRARDADQLQPHRRRSRRGSW